MTWDAWVAAESDAIRASDRWRTLRTLDGRGPVFHLPDGRLVTSFASNDYLGLSQHPRVIAAAHQALDRWGAGTGSSRLIVGERPAHRELQDAVASWRHTASALVLSTGYQANLAVLTTFGAGARIISDELNHASIIDGARLSRGEICVYSHGDVEHAARLIAEAPGRALVVSDTVFSMDGDVAPVQELSELCARSAALLVLDDAHLVFDAAEPDPDATCLRVGTLSKTLGSLGGYVAGPARWVELLVNRARSFIYTTALSPADTAAAGAAVEVCRSSEGIALRQTLRDLVDVIRPGHPSPIVPFLVGDETAALAAAARLLGYGLLVPAIRPPTVPAGTSRLRVSLSAAHRLDDVARLAGALSVLA
jgi:8-amino-7-oxononanoate synthase